LYYYPKPVAIGPVSADEIPKAFQQRFLALITTSSTSINDLCVFYSNPYRRPFGHRLGLFAEGH